MNPLVPKAAVPPEPLLNAHRIAAMLGVPLSWVYDNAAALPAYRIGRALRFRASEIDSWLQTQRQHSRTSLG